MKINLLTLCFILTNITLSYAQNKFDLLATNNGFTLYSKQFELFYIDSINHQTYSFTLYNYGLPEIIDNSNILLPCVITSTNLLICFDRFMNPVTEQNILEAFGISYVSSMTVKPNKNVLLFDNDNLRIVEVNPFAGKVIHYYDIGAEVISIKYIDNNIKFETKKGWFIITPLGEIEQVGHH